MDFTDCAEKFSHGYPGHKFGGLCGGFLVIMLIVLLTNRKDYEPFLADVVFVFGGLNKKIKS